MTGGIVSLLASGTEIAAALGLERRLVGISHECDHPPRVLDRPRVSRPRFDPDGLTSGEIDRAVRSTMAEHGSAYAIDADLLERLDPEIILTQAVCDVCAVPAPGVRETVEARGLGARVLSLDAHTLDDIIATVRQVGEAGGVPGRAAALAGRLEARLQRVERAVAGADRPRVLAIEWIDPPFVPGHWVPEQIHRAGGDTLAGEAGARSRMVDWSSLENLDPDVLLIMPCGYGLDASRADADRYAGRLIRIAPRAIAERRAYVLDGSSLFNRSGPRAVDGVEVLAGLFHPDRWPAPTTGAATWQPIRASP
jgi:iron complex transport system substrate-binding protein